MSLSDFVTVSISIAGATALTRAGLNTPLIAAYHTHFPDRIRFYATSSYSAQMIADGFTVNEPAYKAATVVASQPNPPTLIAIGRRTSKPLQALVITCVDAVQNDQVSFTIIGSDGLSHAISYTIPGSATTSTVATAVAALISAISGFAATIGTVVVSTNTITISRTDGALTDIRNWLSNGFASVTLSCTTADPGIASDIALFQAANLSGWYALILDSNSKAEILAAASVIEATGTGGKVLFCDNSDVANDSAGSSDLFSALQTATYKRTSCEQNNSAVLSYAGASAASYALGQAPGSYTLAYKNKPGVPADTDTTLTETQALILNTYTASSPGTGGKNGNYYKTVSGQNWTWPGVTPSGQFLDLTIGVDWLQVNLQADVAQAISQQPKLPLTDSGIGILGDVIEARMITASAPPYNLIDATRGITVTKPTAASLSPANRAARNVAGLSVQAYLQSAAQTAGVNVVLTA